MIQRFLYEVIKAGFEEVRDNPSLLRSIFETYELSETELSGIQQLLTEKFPTIKHQYARTEDNPPIISIVLGSESETEHYLSDFAVQDDDGSEILSSIWEYTYECLLYTEHPDHTLYLYEILKSALVAAPLSDYGLFQNHFSGMDLAPDPMYIPSHLFARRFVIKTQREFERVDAIIALSKAFKVRGIHIDKSGSPSDVGEVKTLVGVYTEGDE